MIPIFGLTKNRLGVVHDGLTLNDPTDAVDNTYELNSVGVTATYDQTLDSDPNDDGTEVGPVRRSMLLLRLDGTLRAPDMGTFFDKRLDLAQNFDPARAWWENTLTDGVLPMDFSIPTADLTNYPTGYIASRYYVRSRGAVLPPISMYTGLACFFTIELIVPEARRYLAAASSQVGAGAVNNSLAGVWSWPTVSIAMTGAGSATYTITNTTSGGAKSLVLDLSARVNGNTVVVDMKRKKITVNGVDLTGSIFVSGNFFRMEVGTNTIALANTTNATTTTSWRRAWVA